MKPYIPFILILFTFHVSRSTVFGQTEPSTRPKKLPFQQQAQPQAPVDNTKLAIQFFQARDFEKSAELYEKLYTEKPSSYYYIYYLHSLIELKEYKKAEKLIKARRKSDSKAVKYLVDLGYLHYREGNGEKARKLYDDVLDNLVANQQQIAEIANAFMLKGENNYALKTYLKGREIMKGAYPFGFELANVYQRMGDYANLFEEYLNLLEFKDSYLRTVQDRLQNILSNDPDNSRNDLFRQALLTRVQGSHDQPAYADLLWWYSVQQKDFEMALIQAKALDRRRQEMGGRIIQLAQLAVSNGQYEVALDAYKYLHSKGKDYLYYDLSRIEWANTRFFQMRSTPNPGAKELAELEKEFLEVLDLTGERRLSVSMMQNLAHLEAFYLSNPDTATSLLSRAIALKDIDPKQRAYCKLSNWPTSCSFSVMSGKRLCSTSRYTRITNMMCWGRQPNSKTPSSLSILANLDGRKLRLIS